MIRGKTNKFSMLKKFVTKDLTKKATKQTQLMF